jgi:hypothetical protein
MTPIIIWTQYCLLEKRYGGVENLLLQDKNKSLTLWREMERHQAVSARGTLISIISSSQMAQMEST